MFKKTETLEISRDDSNILRLCAAICVIMVHIPYTKYSFLPKMSNFFSSGAVSGLSLFLIFAGYGLIVSFHKNGLNNFWEKKIMRVFAPAWIAQILHYSFLIVFSFLKTGDITTNWQTLFVDILCIPLHNSIDGSMWFLSYLMFCYVSFYLIFLIMRKTLASTIALSIFWLVTMPLQIMMWRNGYFCVAAFLVGIWIGYFTVENTVKVSKFFKLAVLIGCTLYVLFFQLKVGKEIRLNIYSIAVSIILIILVQFLPRSLIRFISPIGKYAFPIYLFEYKIIFSWFPYQSFSKNTAFLFFIALILITFVVAVMYQKFIAWIYSRNREIAK